MEIDETHDLEDWLDDEIDSEYCIYCGETENLNIRHYGVNEDCKVQVLAVNPLPHDHFMDNLKEGYVHQIEMICDSCLEEEKRNGD
jgi:uncharacterized CHY-type Zn-finger protein